MKVMTLNCGSSSVKYDLFDMPDKTRLCRGSVDRVKVGGSFIEHFTSDNRNYKHYQECKDHISAIKLIIDFLTSKETGVIQNLSEIEAIGHRVVHGGEKLTEPVIIDNNVIKIIEECSILAPLHNPVNLEGIRTVIKLIPNIKQVAVFDTAFFKTLPRHIFIYSLPYEWYEKYGIRKYGFHGISHRYLTKRAAALLGKKQENTNVITFHIGNGVSVTAVKGGEAYDHSHGFTPLEGAVMGTRCGHIDPSIPLYVMQKENLGCQEMEYILYNKSGLLGITGKYIDRRDILKSMDAGDQRAKLSFQIECYRLRKYIGEYIAGMGTVDAIVFSGGVGEKSAIHRQEICSGLDFLDLELDHNKNNLAVDGNTEMEISSSVSRVKIFVIPTNEALEIAEDTFTLLENNLNS